MLQPQTTQQVVFVALVLHVNKSQSEVFSSSRRIGVPQARGCAPLVGPPPPQLVSSCRQPAALRRTLMTTAQPKDLHQEGLSRRSQTWNAPQIEGTIRIWSRWSV